MSQSKNIQEFLTHYNEVNRLGAEGFEIDLSREVARDQYKTGPEVEYWNAAYDSNKTLIAEATDRCASVNLTKQEALEIVGMRDRDNYVVDLNGVNGADAYNYFNTAIKNSPMVANAALQAQEETRYDNLITKVELPPTISNQIDNKIAENPHMSKKEVLNVMADTEEKRDKFINSFAEQNQKKEKQASMTI